MFQLQADNLSPLLNSECAIALFVNIYLNNLSAFKFYLCNFALSMFSPGPTVPVTEIINLHYDENSPTMQRMN